MRHPLYDLSSLYDPEATKIGPVDPMRLPKGSFDTYIRRRRKNAVESPLTDEFDTYLLKNSMAHNHLSP